MISGGKKRLKEFEKEHLIYFSMRFSNSDITIQIEESLVFNIASAALFV